MRSPNPHPVRLAPDVIARLRSLAREESARRDANVTWVSLLHEAAREFIARRESTGELSPERK